MGRALEEHCTAGEHQERESHLDGFLQYTHYFQHFYMSWKLLTSGMSAVIRECPDVGQRG